LLGNVERFLAHFCVEDVPGLCQQHNIHNAPSVARAVFVDVIAVQRLVGLFAVAQRLRNIVQSSH
jgi:hypothetical protein